MMERRELDSSGSRYGPVENSCEHLRVLTNSRFETCLRLKSMYWRLWRRVVMWYDTNVSED